MPDRDTIDRFLAQRHVAFVGVSRDPRQFANSVYRHLRDGGRVLYPVNAAEPDTIEGDRCYARLADVPDPLDAVVIMVPPDTMADVAKEAVARGVPLVWLHRGAGGKTVPAAAVQVCREHGVDVVDGACPMMFTTPVGFAHRCHRVMIRGRFTAHA